MLSLLPPIEKRLLGLIDAGETKLLLNLGQVDYLSSAGMRTLLAVSKRLKSKSGKMVLTQIHPPVMDILRMSGFDQLLLIAKTDDEALTRWL